MKYSKIWEAKQQQTPKLPDQKPFWYQAFGVRNAYLAISVDSFFVININYGPRVKSLNNSTITQLSNSLINIKQMLYSSLFFLKQGLAISVNKIDPCSHEAYNKGN